MNKPMSRLILPNKTTSRMTRMAPFRTIEFNDENPFEEMLVIVTLEDGSKQYGLFRTFAFPLRLTVDQGT